MKAAGNKRPGSKSEEGWEDIELPFKIGSGRTIVSGLSGADERLRAQFFRRTADNHLIGKIWFGRGTDGPPGHAHGGAIAYILDEAMGAAAWLAGFPVVAAELKFDYKAMTPLETDILVDAWVVSAGERRIEVRSDLILPGERVAVSGFGFFHKLSRKKVQALVQTLPEEQQRSQESWIQKALQWAPDDPD